MVRFGFPELSIGAKLYPKKSLNVLGFSAKKNKMLRGISKMLPLASGLASAGRAKRKQFKRESEEF